MDSSKSFLWLGAIIVNLAFISIVSVSTEQSYLIGFIACSMYTLLLFKIAHYSESSNSSTTEKQQNLENTQEGHGTDVVNQTPRNALSSSLYGLGIIALGASGLLLVVSVLEGRCFDNNDEGEDEQESYEQCIRIQGLSNIIVSAIPVILVSLALWTKKSIAPCGLTTYLGILGIGVSIFVIIGPENESAVSFLKWFFLTTSVVWVLALSYFSILLENDSEKLAPISWGLNTGGLVFFSVMFAIVEIWLDEIRNWIMLNLFSFLPLIIVGLATDHNFLVFLGASGLLIDVSRLIHNWENIILQFVVLALTGLGVMSMGSWLKNNQDKLKGPIVARIKGKASHSSLQSNGGEYMNSNLEEGLHQNYAKITADKSSSMLCCANQEAVFGWIGAIIINTAFISIVSLSAEQSYLVGFIACSIYCVILFTLGRYLNRSGPMEDTWSDDGDNINKASKTLVGFFYGLGIIALGASGLLLSMSILGEPCGEDNDDDEMCIQNYVRNQGILNIIVTTIPVTLVSLALWTKKSIAPCGLTTYLSIGLFGASIFAIIDPAMNSGESFFKWWFFTTSVVWVLALSYFSILLENDSEKLAPISWGLNTGGLVFFSVMFAVVEIWLDGIENWIMINLLSFLPLIIVGLATDHNFLVFLGASGLLIDVFRLTIEMGTIVRFVVLALTGLGVMSMGLWLKNNQDKLKGPIVARIKGKDSPSSSEADSDNTAEATIVPTDEDHSPTESDTESTYKLLS